MKLSDRVNRATERWINSGSWIDGVRMEILFSLWKATRITPALGVMIGALTTAVMLWIAEPLLHERPLLAAVLIAAEVAGVAWVTQLAYYGGQE